MRLTPVGGELVIHDWNHGVSGMFGVRFQKSVTLLPLTAIQLGIALPPAQHTFGIGSSALPHQENSIPFFSLQPRFPTGHPSHNRQVKSPGSPGDSLPRPTFKPSSMPYRLLSIPYSFPCSSCTLRSALHEPRRHPHSNRNSWHRSRRAA